MSLKQLGEFGLIERLQQGCLVRPEGVVRAIGDDAAVFTTGADEVMVLTTDLLIERVHFLRDAISAEDLGYKSLAVNLSDVAAMGAEPRDAFVSIAIPDDCEVAYVEAVYVGMRQLARQYQVNILGGDTTSSLKDLVINVAVTGRGRPARLMFRDGARPGDIVCVTGPLGESRSGLQLILEGVEPNDDHLRVLYRQHVRPRPHLDEGRLLAASGAVTAAIDISDGLLSDLGHISRQSRLGAVLQAEQVPVSPALAHYCRQSGAIPLDLAVSGGEDYVLLCTVKPEKVDRLAEKFEQFLQAPLYRIGEMVTGEGVRIQDADGASREIDGTSWDHFKER